MGDDLLRVGVVDQNQTLAQLEASPLSCAPEPGANPLLLIANWLSSAFLYSSRASAATAIERLRAKPGFSSAVDGFHIDEYELDNDHWRDGYVTEYAGSDDV